MQANYCAWVWQLQYAYPRCRLRHSEDPDLDTLHTIVLDPNHQNTRLLIKDYDFWLYHSGPIVPSPRKVLRTVQIETEAILNSKPLWYVSADFADHDPVTPNSLLMGRPDGSLPQVVHPKSPEQKKMETITGACWQILGSLYKNLLAWTANRGKVEKFLTRHQSQDGSDTGWPSVTSVFMEDW